MANKIEAYPKYSIDKNGVIKNIKSGKIRKQNFDKGGYKRVMLYDENGVRRNVLVHRLVAMQFIPKIDGKIFVNHKDGDKSNNNVNNLEWCSIAENNRHKREILKLKNGSPKKIIKCIETGEVFSSILEATKNKKLNKGDISHVINCSNGHKTAGGFHWKLLKGEI